MKKYFIIERSDGKKFNVRNKTEWLIENKLFHLDRSLRDKGWVKNKQDGLKYKCEKDYVESLDEIEFGEVFKITEDRNGLLSDTSEDEDDLLEGLDLNSQKAKEICEEEDESFPFEENDKVLIIGDLHSPFTKKGYLQFCKDTYKKYECRIVIFLGDILDNHFSSYHETDPDGYGAGQEIDKAKEIIKDFYNAFPSAKVCIGNHDRIILRKAFTSGISKHWIKDMKKVLEVPNWDFKDYFIINNRLYYHGEGSKPRIKMKEEGMSCIAGHRHSESYIDFLLNSAGKRIFSMQLGCAIDREAYAFAYGKFFKPPHINCGVIVDGVPIIEYMED